jgi:hypothetical protein
LSGCNVLIPFIVAKEMKIALHADYQKANSARRCIQVLSTGRACTQPALRIRCYCRFHDVLRVHTRTFHLPALQDAASLQAAVTNVVDAMLEQRIDARTGSLCLSGLRLAAGNMKQLSAEELRQINAAGLEPTR